VHAGGRLRAQPHQVRAMTNQHGELALLDRLAVHLGNQLGELHPCEQRGIDRATLILGFGNRTKLLRNARTHPIALGWLI
jgi:hypothetical protein